MTISFVSAQAQMNYDFTWELGWGSNGGPDPAGLDTIVFPFGIQNRLAAPASGDLDNDGDVDMIISNQQGKAFFYENIGTPTQPHWGRRSLPSLDTIRVGKGQTINQLHVELADIDNDGDLDLFCGSRWEYGSTSNPATQRLNDIIFFRNIGTPSTPIFTHDALPGLQNQDCAEFTSPCLADIDGDGDLDFLSLGSDSSAYFENIGTSTSPNFVRYYKNDPQNPLHGWSYANMLIPSASLNDLDGDGDLDLFVCDDGGLPWVVENEGTATVPDFDSLTLRTPPAILDTIDFGQFPRHEIADFNNDGILDIIVSPFTPVKFYWFKGASITSSFSVSITTDSNVTCNGYSDGGATASINGGTAPYSYTWNTGITDSTITGLVAGTYSVTVTDSTGISDSATVIITEPAALLAFAVVDSNVTCNGFSNGRSSASANGGTAPYNYSWSNSATTASITGVIAGTYSITVSDGNGCTNSNSTTISEPSALVALTVLDSNDMGNGGGATASATGGTLSYTYIWNNGATTSSLTGLIAGNYSVTISDNNSCTDSASISITAGPITSISIDSNISCNGSADGVITASSTGGTSPYSYVWSNGATNATTSNLVAGTYTVTATDNNGLTDVNTVTITEPSSLITTSIVDSNTSCNGSMDGGVTASAIGGTAPYTYLWNNSSTNASTTGLAAGTYTVIVTDNNGCTSNSSSIVTEPSPVQAIIVIDSNATCNGNNDGGATASASGGTSPYNYLWNNGATTASITGIANNSYYITITDANGCTVMDTIDITVEDTILPNVVTQDINAYLDLNGNASIGTSDIDNGSSDACGIQSMQLDITSFNCNNVGTNTVTLLVTDVNGNSDSATATVTVLDTLVPSIITQNIDAYLDATGQISITASDIDDGTTDNCGVASTSISQTNFTCGDLGTNSVDFIAEDLNGNSDTVAVTVTVLDTIAPIVSVTNHIIYLDASGQASITVTDINNNSSDNCGIQSMTLDSTHFDCSETGYNTVTLTVTDNYGSTASQTATVTVVDSISPTVVVQNYTAYLNPSGTAIIQATDIDNGSSDNCAIQSLTLNQNTFTCADTGSNTVILEVTDVNGNINSGSAIVTIIDTLAPTIITQNIDLYLDANGQASITVNDINNGSFDNCTIQSLTLDITNFDCSKVGTNSATLTATDVSGNSNSGTVVVTVIDTISPIVATQDITVYLDATGMINILTSDIDNGSSDNCAIQSQTLDISSFNCNDLGANTVVLSMTDVNGNVDSQTATVTVVDSITPEITCPADFSNCGPEITVDDPISNDNCDITLQLVSGIPSGNTFPVGTTTNIYEVTDISGNKTSCSVDITRYPQPVVSVREDSTVYYEQSIKLYSQSEFVVEYQWSPSIYLNNDINQQPICTPRETTEYTLIGKSADGCYSEPKSVYITVHPGGELQIPNTFSPNGDGYNDYFEIPGIAFLPEMRMTIFNRNGEILYQKKGYQNDWDGTANGKVLPVATYYYVIDMGSNQTPIKGDITIIK